jgi:2-isopropylmalate synthase
MGIPALPEGCLGELMRVSHAIAEIANKAPNPQQAYVGTSAFAHKAGLHASAIKISPELYNHVDPAVVGNDQRILVTEMAGRASVELKGRELGIDLAGHPEAVGRVVDRVKDLEAEGWSFEAADASFELMLRAELDGEIDPYFTLESWRVIVEHRADEMVVSEATVKVGIGGERVIATAEGNGPVNALDSALRAALARHYPQLDGLELADRRGDQGAHRHDRRPARLDHGGRARQRHRGVLARARRCADVRSAAERGSHAGLSTARSAPC